MRCLECGGRSSVLDTEGKINVVQRRRGCDQGHRWTTIEARVNDAGEHATFDPNTSRPIWGKE